jgi:serine O-acetyltransferase
MSDTDPRSEATLELTRQMLDSYASQGGINWGPGKMLPSKAAIEDVVIDVLALLFPGFFGDPRRAGTNLELATASLLAEARGKLEKELVSAFAYAAEPNDGPSEERARDVAQRVLGTLPHLRELLRTDAEAAFQGDPAALSTDEIVVAYPFIEAISVQRFAHELYLAEVPLIPRIMTEWAHARTGLDIHPGARIGSHFFVDHCTGTVIGETAIIGSHVKLYQGVGLVARSLSGGQSLRGQKRHPTIGDHVTIYANATIVGGETVIGSGSTIGAGVFVMQSVPPNSLVVYEPNGIRTIAKVKQPQPSDNEI